MAPGGGVVDQLATMNVQAAGAVNPGATWNTQPAVSGPVYSASFYGGYSGCPGTAGWKTVDVTGLAQTWSTDPCGVLPGGKGSRRAVYLYVRVSPNPSYYTERSLWLSSATGRLLEHRGLGPSWGHAAKADPLWRNGFGS